MAVPALKKEGRIPQKITYKLILPGDVETEYQVPVVKNLDYSLEQIFEKQLYILLPYLLYQLIWNVSNQVFRKNRKLKERMDRIMGGQVLEFPWDIEYRKQIKEAQDEGRKEGRQSELLSIICRKLIKNKSAETIAEELEVEDVEYIRHICEVAAKYASEYDVEEIYNELYPDTETA